MRVLERRPVTGSLLKLKTSRPPGFDYRPGQHVKLGVPGVLRDYSLVSAPHEPDLEFYIELFPQGRLSEPLRRLGTGATMMLGRRAKGSLALDERRPTQMMIATGTGIAPFVSMLRHYLHGRITAGGHATAGAPHRFVILHGASHQIEFGYGAELEALAARFPDRVIYVPTISRPESPSNRGWTGDIGRVESLAEPLVARLRLTPADTAVFACGNPATVETVARLFGRRGFATRTESFD